MIEFTNTQMPHPPDNKLSKWVVNGLLLFFFIGGMAMTIYGAVVYFGANDDDIREFGLVFLIGGIATSASAILIPFLMRKIDNWTRKRL